MDLKTYTAVTLTKKVIEQSLDPEAVLESILNSPYTSYERLQKINEKRDYRPCCENDLQLRVSNVRVKTTSDYTNYYVHLFLLGVSYIHATEFFNYPAYIIFDLIRPSELLNSINELQINNQNEFNQIISIINYIMNSNDGQYLQTLMDTSFFEKLRNIIVQKTLEKVGSSSSKKHQISKNDYFLPFGHDFGQFSKLSEKSPVTFSDSTITYSSVFQYMIYHKMKLNNNDNAPNALHTDNIDYLTKLYHDYTRYNKDEWSFMRDKVLLQGYRLALEQNENLLNTLRLTGNKILVNIEPYDKELSINAGKQVNSKITSITQWSGWNLTGKILTILRRELKTELTLNTKPKERYVPKQIQENYKKLDTLRNLLY